MPKYDVNQPSIGLPNPTMIRCGNCDEPMLKHPIIDLWGDVTCKRTLASFYIDSDFDYYADTLLTVKEAQPNNFYESDKDEAGDYDYALDTYRDEHPDEFTSALNWWSKDRSGTYAPGTRQAVGNLPTNVYSSVKGTPVIIDGSVGFTSVQVFDPSVTERLNLKFFNYYVDSSSGDNRLGGLILTRDGSTFRAKCVRNDWNTHRCNSKVLSIDTTTADRDTMEAFTYAVIRHGNNHAAPWFTNRASFYKVHAQDCDLTCDPKTATCTKPVPETNPLTVLTEHINSRRVA